MVVIIDFGSQTAHLIERRIKEQHVETIFLPPHKALAFIKSHPEVTGIILSGGPSSVYEKGAPQIDPVIFSLNIPVLAICYGMQLMMKYLGGDIIPAKKREYGPAEFQISNTQYPMSKGIDKTSVVWMSHGDEVKGIPAEFEVLGSTANSPFALVSHKTEKLFGTLFHPEVEHTIEGIKLLKNFLAITKSPQKKHTIAVEPLVATIKETVGDAYVIGAISGGVDSTVAGTLVAKAIGKKFVPFYVENGLMREGTAAHIKDVFKQYGVTVDVIQCVDEMLERLKKVTDPEKKRKIIGKFYIEMFEREMEKLVKAGKDVKFLLQGTIYSDVIESKGTKHSSRIKSHHNVGGLPKHMKLSLLEPLRFFYKDEVRQLGKDLGLPDSFIHQQPFPGPGYAVRIRGEVTKERLER
ncbi:glutamine-hydrolyzing GMP synthase [soil metagenome]